MDELIRPSWKEEKPAQNGTEKVIEAAAQIANDGKAKAGQSAWEAMQEYHQGARAAEIEAKEKERVQVLTDEELAEVPEEYRAIVEELFNKQLSAVFEAEGVKVTPKDREWLDIEAELEDPTSTPARIKIAAREAARDKKKRLQGMTNNQIWEQVRRDRNEPG